MTTINQCEECNLCCKLLPINDTQLTKPQGILCEHCDGGCSIYDTKPVSCTNFDCVYIEDSLDSSLRPDKIGIIFEKVTTKIYMALLEDYNNWKSTEVLEYINNLNKEGTSVVITSFKTGITDIFCAPGHKKEIVSKICLEAK